MARSPAVERFRLEAALLDPTAALSALSSSFKSHQAFLIEKQDSFFLGVAPVETLRLRGGRVVSEQGRRKTALPGEPFAVLGRRLSRLSVEAPAFTTGAVGHLCYDIVRHLERLPAKPSPEEACLMFFDCIIKADRRTGQGELFILSSSRGGAKARAEEIRRALRRVTTPAPLPARCGPQLRFQGGRGRDAFLAGVRALKEHIRAGDIFQGVISESFTARVKAPPLTVYRCLRQVSPSPYSFFIQDGDSCLVGASPERLVAVEDGLARNCPIAGTRRRGRTAAEDAALERALRRSPKERAEHVMLVDLARNDLGRVCAPGSVKVSSYMKTRRFSNVMHLVSEVEGRLEKGRTAWDALKASFPAGTVSGAPKVRAMELIAQLERAPRGFYAGAVLQHDYSGNLDSCIAIRSLLLRRGTARLQAGAGIVADSRPEREYQEVLDKLSGLRQALALAEAA